MAIHREFFVKNPGGFRKDITKYKKIDTNYKKGVVF